MFEQHRTLPSCEYLIATVNYNRKAQSPTIKFNAGCSVFTAATGAHVNRSAHKSWILNGRPRERGKWLGKRLKYEALAALKEACVLEDVTKELA